MNIFDEEDYPYSWQDTVKMILAAVVIVALVVAGAAVLP